MSIFSSIHQSQQAAGAAAAIAGVQELFATGQMPTASLLRANGYSFARESGSEEAGRAEVSAISKHMHQHLTSVLKDAKIFPARESDAANAASELQRVQRLVDAQVACAIESAVMAIDARNTIDKSGMRKYEGTGTYISTQGLSDGMSQRRGIAREAFDERDNKNVLANTVAYNLISGIQAPAMELLFPRVTVPNDHIGVASTIRLTQVIDDVKRTIDGKVADFNRRNLALGMIHPEMLRNDTTRNIPVLRAENADFFAPGAVAANVVFDNVTYPTAPLAFGKEFDIVSMSQTDAMLEKGTPDTTDSLDPDAKLSKVWLKVGADVVGIDVANMYLNNFLYTGQDNYKTQKLNFENDSLMLQPGTLTRAGAAPAGVLKVLKDANLSVRMKAVLSGSVNLQNGKMVVYPNALEVVAVYDLTTGVALATTDANFIALKNALTVTAYYGFDQESRRSNANHSERGDLLETTYWSQIWAVPYRAPLTALKPAQDQDMALHSGTADIELLSQATYIRTTGAAIETLFQTIDLLRSIKGMEYDPKAVPNLLGVARYLVRPLLLEGKIKLDENVNSMNSHTLEKDISAVYVNRLRDMAYRLFRDTDFQAVVESGAAGVTEMPTVLVVTDPMNARYLMVSGDLRMIGPDFNIIVKTSPAMRVQNKIILTFGYPGQTSGNAINPFHFGNMLWSPELVTSLPVTRNNRVTKEISVQPRFRHLVNMAVLGVLTVEGIEKLVGKRVSLDANIMDLSGVQEVSIVGTVKTKEQP